MTDKSPIVKVEFEYADGSIQRLTGTAAEKWLAEVNNVIGLTHLRYSRSPLSEHPWEWTSTSDDVRGRLDQFDDYEGTD